MPNKATVRGVLVDATLAPVAAGKIVATLQGSDIFDGGVRVVTQKVEATTNAQGEWALALIVNGEGETAGTSWTIEGYNQYVAKVFEAKALFLASGLEITLGDLEKTSAQNLKAAREAGLARLILAADYDSYQAMPENQRRQNDLVVVDGRESPPAIQGTLERALFDGVTRIWHGGRPAALLDARGVTLIEGAPPAVAPAVIRQPAILPEGAGIGDSIALDLGAAEAAPPAAASWDLTLNGSSVRDRLDPDLRMVLSEPGEYALAVSWSNAAGTAEAETALLQVAEPQATSIDYSQAAGYLHPGAAYAGTAAAVTGVTNGGNGGWNLAATGSGNAIAMTPAGIRFEDGRSLQAGGLTTGGIDAAFIVLRMVIDSYGSGVAQLFAANPSGGTFAIHNNNGTLQARYHDGMPRTIALGPVPYGQEFVVGIEIDNAAQRVRAYTPSGAMLSETPAGTPGLNYVTVRTGQYVRGTLMRAALFARPAGGVFAAGFEEVIADFRSA
ncbi:hypothetical protein LOS78_15415 [Paracoccus sp. MA]|uniref:hypothetical protein n=1 Tax=Paracoccus sp. MA TaxID=2895796 RepID=UPI001E598091|nr:hypothetical protein [Paracoccus sp. MA]UFM65051.1 hypothetical protein LOS78_15415 [Paracoccus sp. MA]